jgi:outer membrane protein assembly factor BamB
VFDAGNGHYARAIMRNTLQAPVALASDGTHVWIAGSDVNGHGTAGTVTELDASDGHQLWSAAVTIYHDSQSITYDSVTYADGFLWVANGESVTELNASTGKLVRVLSGSDYQFNGPTVVAAAGTKVFVVNTTGNSVTEIDARTGALLHTLSAARYHFDDPVNIAVAGNHAWILNSPAGSPSSVVELAF